MPFWLHVERGGPGIVSHVHDVKGRELLERWWKGLNKTMALRTVT